MVPSPCARFSPGQAGVATGLAKRLRATSAAAAAPNNRTIGGAGTGAGGPPLEPVLPLLELLELLLPLLPLLPLPLPDDPHPPLELQPWLLEP